MNHTPVGLDDGGAYRKPDAKVPLLTVRGGSWGIVIAGKDLTQPTVRDPAAIVPNFKNCLALPGIDP